MKREGAIRETILEAMNEARRLAHEEERRYPEWKGMTHGEKSVARQWGLALNKAVSDIMSLTEVACQHCHMYPCGCDRAEAPPEEVG